MSSEVMEKLLCTQARMYVCVLLNYDICVSVFSEAVEKTNPTVHTSPAAKTYSKPAAAPTNGKVVPASSFKSPAAQNKAPYQPGAPSGRVTSCTEILPFSLPTSVVYSHLHGSASALNIDYVM